MNQESNYYQPKKMSEKDLELAWLGSIYTAPDRCRKHGLFGLDQSMFKNTLYFDLGLAMIRDESFKGIYSMSDEDSPWCKILFDNHLMSKMEEIRIALEEHREKVMFLPACYESYCEEIERRHDEKIASKADWNVEQSL